jgi:hypothetical protein
MKKHPCGDLAENLTVPCGDLAEWGCGDLADPLRRSGRKSARLSLRRSGFLVPIRKSYIRKRSKLGERKLQNRSDCRPTPYLRSGESERTGGLNEAH